MAEFSTTVPTLRRYVPSSDKTGFYLQANVGAGAPVTLQVSNLAGRIFTDNGYEDSDTVPTKLVWAMYDVGLVATSGSTKTKSKSANVYKAFTQNDVSARLSEQTRKNLVQYLSDYRGPQKQRVRQLRSEIETGTTKSRRNATSSVDTRSPTGIRSGTRSQNSPSNVDTSDLGSGLIDSLRVIWRHVIAWVRN